MSKGLMVVLVFGLLFSCSTVYSQDIWVNKDGSIRNIDTRAMFIDDEGVYLATKNEIYRASDTNDRWQVVFSLPAGENEISSLAGNYKNILAGTRRGLYRSQDHGKNWRDVFRTLLPEKNNVLCIDVSRYSPAKVLIGTLKGVFLSEDAGDHWQDISGILKNRRIKSIALNETAIYACGEDGLYLKRDDMAGWERIYVSSSTEKISGEDANDSVEIEKDDGMEVNCIALSGRRIYAGVGKKILFSDDEGKGWNNFSCDALSGTVVHVAASAKSGKLYAATTKGIFEFMKEKGRWFELYKGMARAWNVNKIIFDGSDEKYIWALTDKGLYRLEGGRYLEDQYVDIERNLKSMKIVSDNEPAFKELQQAALRFNDVSPEKIKKWQGESRLRALLPRVTVGIDKKRSTSSEIYTSATKDYIVTGPDDISNGFDVAVYWEIGDLVWSDDQTNIDVRSRLNTQLRNDILDDLRRIYYERKRLQFELMTFPPNDVKARFEKETRIHELTQAIDDLTGNYLSGHMKKPLSGTNSRNE